MKEELEKENKKLKEQIEYLKKDKYLHQIKFERDVYKNINKELEELCNKYEEEHKTTFEEWKRDINKITKIKEELNNLYNADQSERNYKVFIDKVDKILKELE